MFNQCDGKKIMYFFIIIISLISLNAKGETFNIVAEYKPDSYHQNGGYFINKTSCYVGYGFEPYYCAPGKPLESSTIITIPVNIERFIRPEKEKYLSYYKISGPRDVALTNKISGGFIKVKLVSTHIGLESTRMVLSGKHNLPLSRIGGDCFFSHGYHWGTPAFSELNLYSIKAEAQNRVSECYFNSPDDDGGHYEVYKLIYGFRIESPDPMRMPNGNYTGSVKLSIGRNDDISLGDADYRGVLIHDININLTVSHQLRVEFANTGGEVKSNVSLLPAGGWITWVHNEKKVPSVLQNDLPFRIWFNSPFTVALRCQYQWLASGECALKDSKGRTVPLKTYYVNRLNETTLLTTNKYRVVLPVQGKPVINEARAIRFQVVGGAVAEMMKYPGSSFKGDVTLVFDAAVD